MAYLKAVKGEMRGAFESMKVCAEVLMRFPGICRYRFDSSHRGGCIISAEMS